MDNKRKNKKLATESSIVDLMNSYYKQTTKREHAPGDLVRVLGNRTINYKACIGWCNKHSVYLQRCHVKKRNCCARGCRYFEKIKCEFWDKRDEAHSYKKARKYLSRGGNNSNNE